MAEVIVETGKPRASQGDMRRDREYKLACYPITKEFEIGLIDRAECLRRMKEAFVMIYGGQK